MLARGGHRLAEMVRHRIEPFVHGALKLGLSVGEHVAHSLDAQGGFRLQAGELGYLHPRHLLIAPARECSDDDESRERRKNDRKSGESRDVVSHPDTLHRFGHWNKK
jgi:hypothetical protein